MTSPELLPCPFCASRASRHEPDHVWAVPFAECDECGANAPVEAWETRSQPQSPSTSLSDAEIEAALKGIKPWASTLDKRDHLYDDLVVLVKVATERLAMKSKEQSK